jgi:hypothetical protein
MNIITFPLQLTKEFHKQLKEAAFKSDQSIKDYVIDAIKIRMLSK